MHLPYNGSTEYILRELEGEMGLRAKRQNFIKTMADE